MNPNPTAAAGRVSTSGPSDPVGSGDARSDNVRGARRTDAGARRSDRHPGARRRRGDGPGPNRTPRLREPRCRPHPRLCLSRGPARHAVVRIDRALRHVRRGWTAAPGRASARSTRPRRRGRTGDHRPLPHPRHRRGALVGRTGLAGPRRRGSGALRRQRLAGRDCAQGERAAGPGAGGDRPDRRRRDHRQNARRDRHELESRRRADVRLLHRGDGRSIADPHLPPRSGRTNSSRS